MLNKISGFLKGMASITLFPADNGRLEELQSFHIMSNEEAFKHDLEAVGRDMWSAIAEVNQEYKIKQEPPEFIGGPYTL